VRPLGGPEGLRVQRLREVNPVSVDCNTHVCDGRAAAADSARGGPVAEAFARLIKSFGKSLHTFGKTGDAHLHPPSGSGMQLVAVALATLCGGVRGASPEARHCLRLVAQ